MQKMLSRGGNAAEIASFLVPGSAGIKTDSLATNRIAGSDAFDTETTAYLFRDSARTNKEPDVDEVGFLKVLEANSLATREYWEAKDRFARSPDNGFVSSIIENMDALEKTKLSPKAIADMTMTLNACYELYLCKDPKEQHRLSTIVCGLSKELSGHKSPRWEKLSNALIGFAAACAVVACVGAAALGFGAPLVIAGAVGAVVCLMASAGIEYFNQEKGLAKAVSDYQSKLMTPGC